MPTYDYRGTECDHTFEAFQKMSEAPLTACPQCGGPVKRLIGPGAGFIFRGSGFYITDYRSKDYREKAKAESGNGTTSSSSSGSSSKEGEKTKSTLPSSGASTSTTTPSSSTGASDAKS
jgi:putative FmdB family regulatory protein